VRNSRTKIYYRFSKTFTSINLEYKIEFFYLQTTILEGKPNNFKEISRCFKKLEKQFDKLLSEYEINLKMYLKKTLA